MTVTWCLICVCCQNIIFWLESQEALQSHIFTMKLTSQWCIQSLLIFLIMCLKCDLMLQTCRERALSPCGDKKFSGLILYHFDHYSIHFSYFIFFGVYIFSIIWQFHECRYCTTLSLILGNYQFFQDKYAFFMIQFAGFLKKRKQILEMEKHTFRTTSLDLALPLSMEGTRVPTFVETWVHRFCSRSIIISLQFFLVTDATFVFFSYIPGFVRS